MKRKSGEKIPTKLRRDVFAKTNGRCAYCDTPLTFEEHEYDWNGKVISSYSPWHCDHVIPLSKGGKTVLQNLVPSCPSCNIAKSNKLIGVAP
jgi:5-methylcytosine-specific restriction endonuclease McrA